ncbi:MAG: hypothetical protein EP319_18530 [Deltaproteobacteria bacterium]|nr:MAG: hypothetical protein EP319_18530 [Deltaproteobacteria bacterium]
MARKLKLRYRYQPNYIQRHLKFIGALTFMAIHFSGTKLGSMSISFLVFFIFVLVLMVNRLKNTSEVYKEFDVYNTGFEFPKIGLIFDTRGYTNYKDVDKIELIDNYLTIKLKAGSFYEIPLKRISYVGRLSFAEELMNMKESYREHRKERRRINQRNRQAKRHARQKKQAA